MATMGNYCKAYHLKSLRAFTEWREQAQNARAEKQQRDGREEEAIRTLTDESIVYIQENYVVTDGVFLDEHILFDQVTPEWITFCQQTLKFAIPSYESVDINAPQEKEDTVNGQTTLG